MFLVQTINLNGCSQSCQDACSNICTSTCDYINTEIDKFLRFINCPQVCRGKIQLVNPDGSNFQGNICPTSVITAGTLKVKKGSTLFTILDGSPSFDANGTSGVFNFKDGCFTLHDAGGLTIDPGSFFGGSFLVKNNPGCPGMCRAFVMGINGAASITFDPDNCVLIFNVVCFPASKNGSPDCRTCPC